MATGESFDYERALHDPCTVFGEPQEVLTHPNLDATQKREILENWRVDAARLAESAGENMAGGEEPMLQRVNNALLELEQQTGVEAAHKRGIT